MNAIHINWTKPYINKTRSEYCTEDFELLTTVLSALKWREKNGRITMVTDTEGKEYYERIGLSGIWDSVEALLDDVDVDPDVFWAAGKLFALSQKSAPVAVIDTDFVVWETMDFKGIKDAATVHFEDLYPDVYPSKDYFKVRDYAFDERLDWSLKACNTAFCVIKSEELLRLYTDTAIQVMRAADGGDDRLCYMVFAEQRLLNMCARILDKEVQAFSSLDELFSENEKRFTHTWGMKQQMRDNPALRYDFCKRCINRLMHEYPRMYPILKEIDNLKQYF